MTETTDSQVLGLLLNSEMDKTSMQEAMDSYDVKSQHLRKAITSLTDHTVSLQVQILTAFLQNNIQKPRLKGIAHATA
jgi:hypothetical protein